jgi:Kyakuja-Dileera-Zisupton transposase
MVLGIPLKVQDSENLLSFAPHVPRLASIYPKIGRTMKNSKHIIPSLRYLLSIFRWVYTRSFAIDGNFTASHQRQKHPEDDVPLTNGESFMTESSDYKAHLKIAKEIKQPPCTCNEFKADRNLMVAGYDATGIGSVVCLRHGFFQPEATVDFQKGEQ